MKILFLTPRFPYPPFKGEQLRAYQFIKNLSQKGHKIILISFVRKGDLQYLPEINKHCLKVYCVRVKIYEKIWNFIKSIFSNPPIQIFPFFSREMNRLLSVVLKEHKIDLVQIELIRLAHYLPHFKEIPVVVDFVDSLALNMFRRYKRENTVLKPAFYLEWKRMKNYEERVANMPAKVLVVSEKEKAAISENKNIEIIPVGVDRQSIQDSMSEAVYSDRIIFSGNLEYFPNIDAVIYFVKEIFPRVKEKRPELKFYVVGTNPASQIKEFHNGIDVFIIGYVENIYKFISSAYVSVAPLRSGTGMQIKAIEAMACNVPVVATSYAIQGIRCVENKHILVADDPKAFADKVLSLFENESLREKIKKEAHDHVVSEYNWDKIVDKLCRIYDLIVPGLQSRRQ